MKRADVISAAMQVVTDELVICNIGSPSQELHAIRDRPGNFYMLGTMGQASAIGLGLALSQDRPVIAIEGDGAVLTSLGTLATIGNNPAPNFTLLVIDNGSYGSTGNQPTYTRANTALAQVAAACGCENVVECEGKDIGVVLQRALSSGKMTVIVCTCAPGNAKSPVIRMDPVVIRERFMNEVRSENT